MSTIESHVMEALGSVSASTALTKEDCEHLLNKNCRIEQDDELGRHWVVDGQAYIYVEGVFKVFRCSKLLPCDDVFLTCINFSGDKVDAVNIPWRKIAAIGFKG